MLLNSIAKEPLKMLNINMELSFKSRAIFLTDSLLYLLNIQRLQLFLCSPNKTYIILKNLGQVNKYNEDIQNFFTLLTFYNCKNYSKDLKFSLLHINMFLHIYIYIKTHKSH